METTGKPKYVRRFEFVEASSRADHEEAPPRLSSEKGIKLKRNMNSDIPNSILLRAN